MNHDYLSAAKRVNEWVDEYLRNSEKYRVLPNVQPGDVKRALPAEPPTDAEAFDSVFADFRNIILPGVTHWNHPSFFAYFAITGSAPGVLGETLSAALNINGMLWKTCPAATELEEVVLDWLRQMLGFSQPMFGTLMDTASVGTFCAMAAARESLGLDIREKGLAGRADLPPLRIYTSEHSHSSVEKGAIALGFGRSNVRQIQTDSEFRMRPGALKQAIEQDAAAGMRPCCTVATVGTTSTSSIDPVPEIADSCAKYGVWLHVDAAYAGSAAILPEMRYILRGCDRADSFLFNPHKWLFVPFDCTAFYTRRPETLREAFSLVPEYLRVKEDKINNLMEYGLQLGRRFRALKLWMVIRMFGVKGLQKALRSHLGLAQQFAGWVRDSRQFELQAPVPFSLVCFRANPEGINPDRLNGLNLQLMESVNQTGEVYLSHTKLGEKVVLRLAIGNLKTELSHVKRAYALLQEHLATLLS